MEKDLFYHIKRINGRYEKMIAMEMLKWVKIKTIHVSREKFLFFSRHLIVYKASSRWKRKERGYFNRSNCFIYMHYL